MQLAGIVALTGLAATVASLVYLHIAPTGLSAVHNAVSHAGENAERPPGRHHPRSSA